MGSQCNGDILLVAFEYFINYTFKFLLQFSMLEGKLVAESWKGNILGVIHHSRPGGGID